LLSSTSSGSGLESTQQLPIVSCSDGKKNKVELIWDFESDLLKILHQMDVPRIRPIF
jgi:hypothetical protein